MKLVTFQLDDVLDPPNKQHHGMYSSHRTRIEYQISRKDWVHVRMHFSHIYITTELIYPGFWRLPFWSWFLVDCRIVEIILLPAKMWWMKHVVCRGRIALNALKIHWTNCNTIVRNFWSTALNIYKSNWVTSISLFQVTYWNALR